MLFMYENIICVPFRNRSSHLAYFLEHTVPLFRDHLPSTKVVVMEQEEGKPFNRGILLNIAFKEYQAQTRYFFTHDVDINPTKKFVQEHYAAEVDSSTVLGLYTSCWNTLGGIIKINGSTIHRINGFPNNVWGWGCEDKALQNRAEHYGVRKITTLTTASDHPEFILRFNDVDDRDTTNERANHALHYSVFGKLSRAARGERILSSGLNNVQYSILDRRDLRDNVEIIKVSV